MQILVCGGRNFDDYDAVYDELAFFYNHTTISKVIHGGAKGADTMADLVATYLGIPIRVFSAEWNKYGKGAGHIRNKQMLDELNEGDLVIAFKGGKGTANMVKIAKEAGFTVRERYEKAT